MNKQLLTAMFLLFLHAPVCQAEEITNVTTGGAGFMRTPQNADYYRLQQDLQEKKGDQEKIIDNTDKAKETNIQKSEEKITVNHIRTNSSNILTDKEIHSIIEKYEGKVVTMRDLYLAIKEFNTLYQQKKFITAQAILPPQKVKDGVIHIQLVEGRIGELQVENNRHTNKYYITDRMTLRHSDLMNVDQLERDIIFFNRTTDIQLQAELKPGKDVGTTDIVLKPQEPVNSEVILFTDNAGRTESGLYRSGVSWVNNSLTGHRDTLSLNSIYSKGMNAGSVSYYISPDKWGTRLGVSYEKNQSSLGAGAFESLDIKGNSSNLALYISHPFVVTPTYKNEGFLEIHEKTSDSSFSGATLVENRVKTGVIGFASQSIGNNSFWYMRQDLSTCYATNSVNHQFYHYNISYVKQAWLPGDKLLILRASGQWANLNQLPSSEQFSLGGMSSVRGYPEGLLIGDKGYFLSAELDTPVKPNSKTKFITFIDHGGVFPYKGNNEGISHEDFLTSIGCGFLFNYSKYQSAKIVIGLPLSNLTQYDQKVRVHLFYQTTIF